MKFMVPLLLAFLSCTAFASNQHEHFYEYFTTDAFFAAYEEVLGVPVADIPFRAASFRSGATHSVETLNGIFGESPVAVFLQGANGANAEAWLSTRTIGQIAKGIGEVLGVPRAVVLPQLFELGPQVQANKLVAFLEVEHVRRGIMVGLFQKDPASYTRFLIAMSERTLAKIPAADRQIIAFSVPWELFDRDSLVALRAAMEKAGTKPEYYLSYPRYVFTESEEGFRKKLGALDQALADGWAQGFDMTGSIYESNQPGNPEQTALILQRARDVARVVGKHHGVFKLHSFEAANEGPFYDAFWKLFEEMAQWPAHERPTCIAIGHLGALSPADNERFASLQQRGLNFSFDATFDSDEILHGYAEGALVQTVFGLYRAGLDVGAGGDGQGILRLHSLAELREIFGRHLPAADAEALWNAVAAGSQRSRCRVPLRVLGQLKP